MSLKEVKLPQEDNLFLLRSALMMAEAQLKLAVHDCKRLRPIPLDVVVRLHSATRDCRWARLKMEGYERRVR